GTLVLSSDTINAPLANQGTLVVQNTSAVTGSLTTTASSMLRVQAGYCFGSSLTVANGFTNQGTIELTNSGGCGTPATLNVTSGTLTNAASGTISALTGDERRGEINAQPDNQAKILVNQGLSFDNSARQVHNTTR